MKYSKLLGSVALATLLATGFSGCAETSDDTSELENKISTLESSLSDAEKKIAQFEADKIPFGDGSFSPYERVAVFPTVKKEDGTIDYNATNAKVSALATTFAKYVANTDEAQADESQFKGGNWIVAGLESETAVNSFEDADVSHHILAVPTPFPVDPTQPLSKTNTKKVKVVEVCNKEYASKALGVKNVGGENGAKVAYGSYHSTALPCEISIYSDDKGIYVDMLNPETIFTLFFTEVFSSAEMENIEFKKEMMTLPSQVKDEIYTMIYNAFDEKNETYTKTSTKIGTLFTSMSQALKTTDSANGGTEPYRHYSYTSDNAKEFTSADAKEIAAKLISVMTSEEEGVAGVQEKALLDTLPSTIAGLTPGWRSARLEPLKVPGGSYIVEACSPVYAKEALKTGEFHSGALPCEIAVTVNPDNNKTIDISFLNPEFMFGALFADAMGGMNDSDKAAFGTIINNINNDLKTMVDYTMEHNITNGTFSGENTKINPVQY